MKNIFSKKTAEKRTQNGVKTDSKRTNYGIPILLFTFLTLGVGQMWGAQTYYYSGEGNGTDWSKKAMTVSTDGFYEYYYVSSTTTHKFKIGTSADQWAYNYTYVSKSFNGTNVSNIGDYGSDNCYCWHGSAHYILVYYPNTIINTTSKPIICASTTQPNGPLYLVGDAWIGSWSTTGAGNMTKSGSNWTKTVSSVTKADHTMKVSTYNYGSSWGGSAYQSTSTANIYSTSTDGDGNLVFQPAIAGDVTITFNPSTKKINLTCAAPTITFDMEGGSGGTSSQNTYYNEATSSITAPTKTGYDFGGYYDGDNGTGNQIINASGVWQKNKSGFTDNSSTAKWVVRADHTLYAKWTEKTYSLTFSCSNGTIKVNGASVASGSTASVNHFTTKTLVATPNSGYRFVNWTLSGTNTNKVTIADASAASTTITATATGATVTANFEALPSGQLDIVAGANGQVKKESGSWGSSASYTEINTAQNLNIYAKANTGYHFVEWTKVGDGSITTNAANGVYAMTARGSATVTANFAETKHNVSVQYKCGSTTIKTATTASNVGEVTTSNVSAPEISGYNFSNWTVESGVTATTSTSSTPITIKTKSSGTYTITANYTEDLSTPYVIKGGTAITGSDWTVDIPFTKKSGESTGTIAYAEIPISAAVGDGAQTAYNLKVYNNSNSHWIGLNEGSGDWWYYSDSGEKTLTDNTGNNIQLRANVVGTYTVKLDYTTSSSPKITITWPVALSIYRSNPTDGTNIGDHAWNSMPTSTSYRWNLDLEANTTYEFKINDKGSYYGHDTEITTSISNRVFSTGTDDTKLKTKSAGRFIFTWDGSGHHLTVVYPKSADMTASPASVYTGGTTTLIGYASELGSGSHTITYEFYKGTELIAGNLIATKVKTESATYQQETQDVTVNFDGNTTSQIYTIQIKEGGSILATNTVTVYRKWDIYVHDVASWNAMKLYMYSEDGLTHNEEWPGPDCSNYNGSTTWYTVPLDAKYDRFILNNNAGKKQTFAGEGALRTDITTYIPGTYWYTDFNSTAGGISYYGLTNITLSTPTVTIAATITNATQLNLTGTVTNCGGDGSFASDMKEVYFNVNNVKDATSITASTTDGTFTKSLNNPTPDNTNNTLQAAATNIYDTGTSSAIQFSRVTLDKQSGSDGTSTILAVNGASMASGATAPTRTGYTFGGYYASTGGSDKQYYNASMGSTNNWDQTTATKTIYAKWTPNTYRVQFHRNGGAGDVVYQNFTYDVAQNLTANTYTRTGYTFAGWALSTDGAVEYANGANVSNLTATNEGTFHLYAKWTPISYTVVLDKQTSAEGYGGSEGTVANQTVTFDATPATVSGTMPTAAQGYGFMGFYSATGGNGRRFIDPSGNWVTSAGDTISGGHWVKPEGITLYAYYKEAQITGITFSPGNIVAPSATVTVTATIEPTPVGPTTICWRVLYSNDNPLDPQPTFTPVSGGTVSFPAHSASGSYKVEATLRKGASCGGDEIHTFTAPFQVAGDHTVTVQYKCGNTTIKASTSVTGKPLEWTAITAPEIVGYSFSKWVEGDGITIDGATEGEKASATINFKAIYDGKLTAVYTQKRMIYFYNTLNWENVYVYFYKNDSYWGASNQGTGANTTWTLTNTPYGEGLHGQMLPVEEGSKIYYFDAEAAGVNASYTNVVFTELNQHGCDYFYDNNKVVRRGDYQSTTMPLFVPLSEQPAISKNSGTATYYCEGYWMNYPANSGYTLRIYDTPGANNATGASREFLIPFSEDVKMPLKQEVEVNFSGESWFIIYRNDGKYLEGSHTFKQTDHGDKKITSNDDAGSASKMRLISDGSGIYTFTLSFRGDGGENYDYYLNVDFPATVGDYRIVYSDNATWSNGAHSAGWYHPSDIIGKNTSETEAKEDTVSFFISHGSSPSMKFQRISAISESAGSYGQITWEDVPSGSITIPTSIEASGVYNFIVTQPAGGASISLVKAEPYTGNYYIRTDCAGETKWNNFRSPDHLITYSEYSITHGGYSHYYAHWVQTDDKSNIQFCIANDYSSAISDTLVRENNSDPAWANITHHIDEKGNIQRNANVRFMWNQSTNKVSRAYVDGAQGTGSNNFLYMLSEDNKIRKADESALDDHKVFFNDNENWIYEANIQAQPNAAIKLLSNWGTSNTITQYFKGTSSTTEDLIDGSGENWYNIRLLYDFKTNRLVAAMVPTGNIEDPTPIHADVMFIREHQGDIDQLTFTDDGSITDIETAYAVMRFNKWTLNNKEKTGSHNPLASPASIYERSLYYVSFPFRVKLSEVFGFGTYGQHWIIQRYRGDLRAQQGYWAESAGFWEFIWNRNGEVYLEPNEGYILTLETELLGEESSVWGPDSRSNQIELFFPSYGTMPNITNTSITQTLPAHTCTINRAATEGLPDTSDPSTSYNRTIFDSHWNIMSVPTYLNVNNPSLATTTWLANDSCPKFLYTWNPDDNTLTATSGTGFMYHAMHAYTVQYYGNVTWTTSVSPAAAPQRNTEYRGEYEFCLEVQQDEQMIDRTFVRLSDDENVTTGFEFGEDMTKQFNSRKANIFTIAGNTSLGGNSLPLSTTQTTVVPVGVSIRNAGDYTFAIPEGTEGIGVTLVDNETGVRTSLSALSYTVNLTAGSHDGRFVLDISPIAQTPTGVETVTGEGLPVTGARKVMIDGILYIVKDGKIFDARGARVE